ncbi:MAG: hypothetical protein P3X23_000625, partial [Thermosynechococcus sp. Uc]|uniref:hypothetical protein n=1 Tax=Thermosynechococcus sp. Uc TaxID=3034853 RepID=UPI00259F4E16
FIKASQRPTRFALKEFSGAIVITENPVVVTKKTPYKERDLHPFLTYFLYTYQSIYTKTIYHEESSKDRYSQWLHPDMVGVYFPLETWVPEVLDVAQEVGSLGLKLFSYELKRELTFSNLRESFFQAVSNSSWAHQGYLVAAEFSEDADFLQELKRLSNSFGIGVIRLAVENPDDSEILIPAREREFVDIETMNRLAEINPNFKEFLKRIKTDLASKEIRKERYERVYNTEDLLSLISKNGGLE